MNNFFKKVILLLSILILSTFVLSGCSKNNEAQPLVKNYEKLLNEGETMKHYMNNISKKSKEYISKEEFIKRYSSIYSGIGANDIKISIGEINSKTQIPTYQLQ